MKKLFSFLFLVIPWLLISQNSLDFDEQSVDQNTVFDFSIKSKNNSNYSAIQFDINFNKDAFSLDSDHTIGSIASDHSLSVSNPSDGVVRVVIYSGTNKEISSGEGELVKLKFKSKYLPGNHDFQITSIVASDKDKNEVSFTGTTKKIKVLGSIISFNSDLVDFGRVEMKSSQSRSLSITNNGTTDLVINSVSDNFTPFSISQSFPLTIEPNQSTSITIDLDTESKGLYEKKIKFDSNDQDPIRKLKEITLKADIYGVNEIYVGSSSGDKDSEIAIPVTIKNQEEFTGFQFDIILPSNIEYVTSSVKFTARNDDHEISANIVDGNKLRFISYSSTNKNFSGNDGEVFTFKLIPKVSSGTYSLYVQNAFITNKDSENLISASYNGSITVNSPRIEITPNSIDYGNVPVDIQVSKKVKIKNTGSAKLKINNIVFSSNEFSISSLNFPIEIDINNEIELDLLYNPSTLGQINSKLTFVHNDPSNTTVLNLNSVVFSPNYISVVDQDIFHGENQV